MPGLYAFGSSGITFPVFGSVASANSKAHSNLAAIRHIFRSAKCIPGQIRLPAP